MPPTPRQRSRLSRRRALQTAAAGLTFAALGRLDVPTWPRLHRADAAPPELPSIQYDTAGYLSPVQEIDGTLFQFPPVYTLFVTARLTRVPDLRDQVALATALDAIEAAYPFSPSGLFTYIAYGIRYFERLPGGMRGELVARHMPRLISGPSIYALEEATPSVTDVSPSNPAIRKARFNVPVAIESNDLLITLQSDVREHLSDAAEWLTGSQRLRGESLPSPLFGGLVEVTSTRLMFVRPGLPRALADSEALSFAARIPEHSPMWMGFSSQQADSNGPAAITCFQGTRAARFTDATDTSYFADGAIQHLSHVILDLEQWYAEPYAQRVQYMFRSNPPPASGAPDQFTDGGGSAFLKNEFRNRDDARRSATGANTPMGERRLGHVSSLQRASRAADGTPFHLRVDGPGFDSLDVPDGRSEPKLHFSIFMPTAESFSRMRRYQASEDLGDSHSVARDRRGIERFITATRRQNFLVPPRAHRAFPLVELLS